MVSAARAAWRIHKPRILIELAANGVAWDIQMGVRFELRMSAREGVPFCQVVAGDEVIVQGVLV